MRVALLGFTVPDDDYAEIAASDRVMPAQTHRFAWSLVAALRHGGVEELRLISAAPVTSFPGNPRIFWWRRRWEFRGVPGVFLPFVNLPVLKHLTRFLSCWIFVAPGLRQQRPNWLVVHGVHSPFLWFAALFAPRSASRSCVVLTDPPGVITSTDGWVTALLKRLDIWVVRQALARFDAAISLTEALATDYAPGVPALVLEGIQAEVTDTRSPMEPSSGPRPLVVYAGGVQREYGVLSLVKAVTDSDLDVELRVFGKGPDDAEVKRLAAADERVVGPVLLAPEELPSWYRSAVALVQPRPIDQSFVPYSFPSKLIEYLSAGVPVISTRLPSIPDDYEPYVVWAEPDTSEGIRNALVEILGWTDAERESFGRAGADFIRTTRSTRAQSERIRVFLEHVAEGASGGGATP
jgi:glycosyltransferase involved in cell wall biosynthesis